MGLVKTIFSVKVRYSPRDQKSPPPVSDVGPSKTIRQNMSKCSFAGLENLRRQKEEDA